MRKLIAPLAALALLCLFATLLQSPEAVRTKVEPRLPKPKPSMTLDEQIAGLQKLRFDVRKGRVQGTTGEAYHDLLKRYEKLSVDPSLLDSKPENAEMRRKIREVQRDFAKVMPIFRRRLEAMEHEREKQRAAGKR